MGIFENCLKIGSTAFGGFLALVSVCESIIVRQYQLLSHEEILDGISLATILPGPVAVNVVAYIGYKIWGIRGAFASTTGVLLPTYILVVSFTAFYFQVGEISAISKAFAGFIPAMVAIILVAIWRLSKKTIKTLKNWQSISIAVVAFIILKFV